MNLASTTMYFLDPSTIIATTTAGITAITTFFTAPIIILFVIAVAGMGLLAVRRAISRTAGKVLGGGRRGRRRR